MRALEIGGAVNVMRVILATSVNDTTQRNAIVTTHCSLRYRQWIQRKQAAAAAAAFSSSSSVASPMRRPFSERTLHCSVYTNE